MDEAAASERHDELHDRLNELKAQGRSVGEAVKLDLVKPTEKKALEQIKAKRDGGAIGAVPSHVPRACALPACDPHPRTPPHPCDTAGSTGQKGSKDDLTRRVCPMCHPVKNGEKGICLQRSIAPTPNPGNSAMAQHWKKDHATEYKKHMGGRRWEAVLNSLQVATPEAASAAEGMPPLTAGGKRKAAEARMPSELAAPASAVVAVAAKPEKEQTGRLSCFSKRAA